MDIPATSDNIPGTLVLRDNTGGFNLKAEQIVNADISASAAIAGTKIAPNFGSQLVTTTGDLVVGKGTANSRINVAASDNTITNYPLRVDNLSNNYGAGYGAYGMSNRVGTAQTVNYKIDIGGTFSVDTNGAQAFTIHSSGRADVFASSTAAALGITGTNIQGATTNYAVIANSTFGSSATVRGVGFGALLGTEDASFTLSSLIHFRAVQGTIGASSTVTSQFGLLVDGSLTGATNNFGVRSDINSGSGRWNFYAGGTANNYFAGTVAVGTTSPNAAALLDVSSTTKGFLPPRMTTAQRDAISTPPAGLMIYNTTTNKLNVRTASSWEAVTSS